MTDEQLRDLVLRHHTPHAAGKHMVMARAIAQEAAAEMQERVLRVIGNGIKCGTPYSSLADQIRALGKDSTS